MNAQEHNPPYENVDGNLYHTFKNGKGEVVEKLIANFYPKPQSEITRDDGEDTELTFEIGGVMAGGGQLACVQVPAGQFHNMGWIEKLWGLSANVEPGSSNRERVRHCIQQQAGNIPRQTIYTHTGWRNDGNGWFYLHSGGAIGRNDLTVDLSESGLERYKLPEPGGIAALTISLFCLNLAPWRVTLPLLVVAYLVPLMEPLRQTGLEPSLLPWLSGPTGVGKSSLAALLACHFGDFNNKALPASFKDTTNYLERKAFSLKDSLLVVDDFHPVSTGADALRMEATAQALCRIFGDRTARGRLTSDIRVRRSKPARCMGLVTGEDLPTLGQSGAARILTIELERDDLDFAILSTLQDDASMLGKAMAGYIQWLAPQMDKLPEQLKAQFLHRRDQARIDGHKRMPEVAAWLYIGWNMLLQYAECINAISRDTAGNYREQGWSTIIDLCRKQGQRVAEDKPTTRFINILSELIASGEVELAQLTGSDDEVTVLNEEGKSGRPFIGWYDSEWFYLLPGQVFKAVSRFCRDQGGRFPISEGTLWKSLDTEGLIEVETGSGERRRKVRKRIGGQRYRVVKLTCECLKM